MVTNNIFKNISKLVYKNISRLVFKNQTLKAYNDHIGYSLLACSGVMSAHCWLLASMDNRKPANPIPYIASVFIISYAWPTLPYFIKKYQNSNCSN